MFNAKKYKLQQVEAWNGVARSFGQGFSGLALPATLRMIQGARLQPEFQVLEVACANGSDAFLTAEQLGPSGKVTGIDLAPTMIEVANATKESRGVRNVDFQVMDAEKLSFSTASFDAVLCKWALEQFTDSHGAMKEAARVLKPGGVFSTMVVGRAERSKFLTLGPLEIFRINPDLITSEDGAPSTFDLGGEGSLAAAYNAAGFVNVHTRAYTLMVTCADGETYWEQIWNGNGYMRHKLVQAGPAVLEMAKRATMATANSYCGVDGIRLPFEVVLGTGEKPNKGRHAVQPATHLKGLDELASETSSVRGLDVTSVYQLMQNPGTVVIDTRSSEEFAAGRLPGAVHIGRADLELRIEQAVNLASTKQIVLYSSTGRTSRLSAATLNEMGYRGVVSLDGGYQAWIQQQGPVVTESAY